MRVSIVIDDNMVAVGGVGYTVDCSFIDREIHAIQWYEDNHGEVEFRSRYLRKERRWDRRPNAHIFSFSAYERVLDEWHERKLEADEVARLRRLDDEQFERIRAEAEERQRLLDEFMPLVLEAQAKGLPPPEMPAQLMLPPPPEKKS